MSLPGGHQLFKPLLGLICLHEVPPLASTFPAFQISRTRRQRLFAWARFRRHLNTSASLHEDPNISHQELSPLVGQSGRAYMIDRVLQDKGAPFGRVSLARYVRPLEDTVKERATLVHKYFNDNLLTLVQRDLPRPVTKEILKNVLRGLADLHELDIVHNDIKPNNVLIETEEAQAGIKIFTIKGTQVGNWMWRSPEAHAQGQVEKPSDIFSFGIMCIYAVTQKLVLYVSEEEIGEDGELLSFVLDRQISYFAELESLEAFLKYLGESPWVEVFEVLRSGFNRENPRKPFYLWQHDEIDDDFKDLVCGMTNFDPAKRLTAQEALGHRWFQDV